MNVTTSSAASRLGAGLGLKPEFFDQALACQLPGVWWEVHPENYMVDGGPRLHWLQAIAQAHPVSLHSVSLSLGAPALPDAQQLARLAALVERIEPAMVSEHLAWSAWRGIYQPDLLPLPRTKASLAQVVRNVDCVQNTLRRRIAIENPSHYLRWDETHECSEPAFLAELVRRAGCDLLLDINNVFVSANNLGRDPWLYLDELLSSVPNEAIAEIHVAGHTADPKWGQALLIDSHDTPIADPVWALYDEVIKRIGARPTLIERDGEIPAFSELMAERNRAQARLDSAAAKMGGRSAKQFFSGDTQPSSAAKFSHASEPNAVAVLSLVKFHDAFQEALSAEVAGPDSLATPVALAALCCQPGFSVYRNTPLKGCLDALEASYPTVARMVGSEWFRAAAAVYARARPPRDARLLFYGENFAEFLGDFAPAQDFPFLPGVARLDRAWTEAHVASAAPVLTPAELTELAPQAETLYLRPHPAARWVSDAQHPIDTLWQRARAQTNEDQPLDWQAQATLITRPELTVRWCSLPLSGVALLKACAIGDNLAQACGAALEVEPTAALSELIAVLLKAGALQSPSHIRSHTTTGVPS